MTFCSMVWDSWSDRWCFDSLVILSEGHIYSVRWLQRYPLHSTLERTQNKIVSTKNTPYQQRRTKTRKKKINSLDITNKISTPRKKRKMLRKKKLSDKKRKKFR
uniref:Uncharacterized protein n=1 Tax=Cacopsylla melanoneura TaxID=428564 RepID=A0A8D9DVQ4_9HEMI